MHSFTIKNITFGILVLLVSISTLGIFILLRDNPRDVERTLKIKLAEVARPSTILDRSGKMIGSFSEEVRIETPLSEIPLHVQRAFLAAEDSGFYEHRGISVSGMFRSAIVNFKRERVAQGGSTITQQLVRQFLLTRDRTFSRKIKEIDLALRLERQLTKQQILELWLNHVYLGNNAWGIGAAAQLYFHKNARDLNVGEAAVLAGLPQAPSRYAPHLYPAASRIRKDYVLQRMQAKDWLTRPEAERWRREKVAIWRNRTTARSSNPWITEAVRVELWQKMEARNLPRSGLKVSTTIDGPWQEAAQVLVNKYFKDFSGSGLEFAMATVDIPTGEIRTLIGGMNFKGSQFNRAIHLSRPFGEAIYPIIFGWAADEGMTTVPGYQTLGSAALLSSFQDADRVAATMGYHMIQKKLLKFAIKQRDISAIDQSMGSPLKLAQLWRSIAGRPLLQNSLVSVSIERPDHSTQNVRTRGLPVEGLSEEAAYSLRSWLLASGFSGRAGEELRIPADSSWNHWEVAVGHDMITAIWAGADQRAPTSPEAFQKMKVKSSQFLDEWLAQSGSTSSPSLTRKPPAGLSWQLVRRADGKLTRIPFPVLVH